MRDYHARWQRTREVPCSHCGAPPGAHCTNPDASRRGVVHYVRANRARRLAFLLSLPPAPPVDAASTPSGDRRP